MVGRWDRMYVMGDAARLRASAAKTASPRSRHAGNSSPQEVAYDYLTGGLDRFLFFPMTNYVDGDHEPIREMLTDPARCSA